MSNPLYMLPEILEAIQNTESALIISHIAPDGDTLGSAMALKKRMERMGKRAWILVDANELKRFSCLPGIEEVLHDPDQAGPWQTVIAVDISSPDRMGKYQPLFEQCEQSIVIDHHKTNQGFGKLRLVDGTASATAVILYRLFNEMHLPLTQEEAICLYIALSTDTGNFIHDNTTPEAFHMMAALLEAGLPLDQYAKLLFEEKDKEFVSLLKYALSRMKLYREERIAGMVLTQEDMFRSGAGLSSRDGLIDYAINTKGVRLAFLACEEKDGKTKLSFRSRAPYDVSELAIRLGGGGHSRASGATLDMPLAEAVPYIVKALSQILQDV